MGVFGSILSSLEKNKKVIAVPRLHKYGEHVNDHQKEIIETFNKKGYIIGINEVKELGYALKKVKDFKPQKYVSDNSKLLNIVDEYISKYIEV